MLYNVIDRRLKQDFIRNGYIDIRNKEITSTDDLINVARLFRNPLYETFRVIYCKDNKIVGYESVTSKIPNNTRVFETEDRNRAIYEMKDRMERLNADGYYLLHNHPSGNARASKHDIAITSFFIKNVNGFKSHIIINSGTYAYIEKETDNYLTVRNEIPIINYKKDEIDEILKHNSLYDIKITSREDVVNIAYSIKHNKEYSILILADASNRARMIMDIPDNFFKNPSSDISKFLKNRLVENGADKVFLFTTRDEIAEKGNILKREEIFFDCIFYKEDIKKIIRHQEEKPSESKAFFKVDETTRAIRVCESDEMYGGSEMKTYNYKWIDFLSTGNTIKITNKSEFEEFKKILTQFKMIGILGKTVEYEEWQHLAEINGKNPNMFIFEYNNSKGLSWYDIEKESEEWYDRKPYTIEEVKEEIMEKEECMLLTAKYLGNYNDRTIYEANIKLNGNLENIGIIRSGDRWTVDKIFVSEESKNTIVETLKKNMPILDADAPSKSYNVLDRVNENEKYNVDEFVEKLINTEDFYNICDDYGNIETDQEAKKKLVEEILDTLNNKPEDILKHLEETLEEYEPSDKEYTETSDLIVELKDMMYLDTAKGETMQIGLDKITLNFDYDLKDFYITCYNIDGRKEGEFKIKENSLTADAQNVEFESNNVDSKIKDKMFENKTLVNKDNKEYINLYSMKDYDKQGLKDFLVRYMPEITNENHNVNTETAEE